MLSCLTELFVQHGPPEHIHPDNGSEFTAKVVRHWLKRLGVQTLFIEPGSLGENSYNESFNGKLRDELLNGEIFYTLKEAPVLIEEWRMGYNTFRPHSSLKYRPPGTGNAATLRIKKWRILTLNVVYFPGGTGQWYRMRRCLVARKNVPSSVTREDVSDL